MPFYTVDIMSLFLIIFIVPKFMTAFSLQNCNNHNLDDFVIKVCIIIIIIIILAYQGVRPCGLLARWAWAHPLWSLVTLLNQFHASITGHVIFHMISTQVIWYSTASFDIDQPGFLSTTLSALSRSSLFFWLLWTGTGCFFYCSALEND